MKTVTDMAKEAGFMGVAKGENGTMWFECFPEEIERFAELVRADERSSWPAEMEAMERQVNILTDAMAKAKAEEREACAKVCEPQEQQDDPLAWKIAAAIRARGRA